VGLLRTLLALSVLLDHVWNGEREILVGGRLAVQTFYLISGFLISYVLMATDTYRHDRLKFYQNRFLRLYPAYAVVAVLTLAAHAALGTGFLQRLHNLPGDATAILLASTVLLFGQDWILFMGVHHDHLALTGSFRDSDVPLYEALLVPQAWSLSVELTFYLVAPFLITSRRWMWVALLASLGLRAALIVTGIGRSDPWTYRFFPSELALFLIGALSQQMLLPRFQRLCARLPWLPGAGVGALLALSFSHFQEPINPTLRDALFLAVAATVLPLAFIFQCRHKWDRLVGELSYPLYISHMLVILLFSGLGAGAGALHSTRGWAAIVMASVAAAVALNVSIAAPIKRVRRRLKTSSEQARTLENRWSPAGH